MPYLFKVLAAEKALSVQVHRNVTSGIDMLLKSSKAFR
ncbi:hypothetical protein O9993_17225 [Vibrio lentus]|nr:hypothetical protein [Vibrio lentus]